MCTAINLTTKDHYFGRTLDLEYNFFEQIVITPFNFKFSFSEHHYAIIGVATVANGYPLYYDAINNAGLAMAGLNFPDNACYFENKADKINIAPFEFIPFVLSQCDSVKSAKALIKKINIINKDFSAEYKSTPLHFIVSDKSQSVTVEQLKDGLRIYDNEVGVLTNNPPFEWHTTNLKNYANLTSSECENRFCEALDLPSYSKGMGAIGLPGDYSSASRFVKAAFVSANSVCGTSEEESVGQFFHILNSVAQPRGCVRLKNEKYPITVYTSCYNLDKGLAYYTTYENSQINCVDIKREDLNKETLICYDLITKNNINYQN